MLLPLRGMKEIAECRTKVPPDFLLDDPDYRLHRRFDRLGRLYGDHAVSRLMAARVVVFGLGGVGSFAAEALARSAIGHLTVVDFDEVCVTNCNRQLQALSGTIGRKKADVLAERLREINPRLEVVPIAAFYKAERSAELLAGPDGRPFDFVVDAIDNITAKMHLIATCRAQAIPLVACMGAAGKLDPTKVALADLSETRICPLAKEMRKLLRQNYAFPHEGPMGVPAVYSTEPRHWPRELTYDRGLGFRCVCPHGDNNEHTCDSRNLIDGTTVFVTGAFGLAAAAHVVNTLTADLIAAAPDALSRHGDRPTR